MDMRVQYDYLQRWDMIVNMMCVPTKMDMMSPIWCKEPIEEFSSPFFLIGKKANILKELGKGA